MAFATVNDVEKRLGRELTADESAMAEVLLADALIIIKSVVDNFDQRIADGTLDPEVVSMVQARMVVRVIRNPEGYVQETDGDYSYTLASGDGDESGLFLTDQERKLLGIASTIFSFRPTLPLAHAHGVWHDWGCGCWH